MGKFKGCECQAACLDSKNGQYAEGTVVTVTETPATGYTFAGWSGAAGGAAKSVSVTLSNSAVVEANFNKIPHYQLTVTEIGNGSGDISPKPKPGADGLYANGTVVTR
jgi:uncharacterized repeat protein (TIGR02543 family)